MNATSGHPGPHLAGRRHLADLVDPRPRRRPRPDLGVRRRRNPNPRQRHPPADLAGLRRTALRCLSGREPVIGPGGHPAARRRVGAGGRDPDHLRGLQRRLAPGGDPLRTREQGCIIAREVLPPLGYDAVFVDEVCRIVDVTTPAPRQSLSRMRWSVTPTGCGGSTTPASPSPPAGSGWIRRSTPTGSPRRSSRSCSPRRASPWPPPIWNGRGPC